MKNVMACYDFVNWRSTVVTLTDHYPWAIANSASVSSNQVFSSTVKQRELWFTKRQKF